MSFFESALGLPLHPLVVHAVVVLLPLSALGVILLLIRPAWIRAYGWLVLVGLVVGAVAAVIAKESGEILSLTTGLPVEHAEYGEKLPVAAVALTGVTLVWMLVARRKTARTWLAIALALIAAVLAIGVIVLTVLAGHSGAEAVWGQRAKAPASDAPAAGQAASVEGTASLVDEVAAHSSPEDCWAIVGDGVYDLTAWISRHPGGGPVIEAMCGTDATAAFEGEHAGQREPEEELAAFRIGP